MDLVFLFDLVHCSLSVTNLVLIFLSDWEESLLCYILMYKFVNSNSYFLAMILLYVTPSEVVEWSFC